MSDFDIEAIRSEVRVMEFVRGTPAEIAMWREDMAESRANLVIEDMMPTPNDDAFFDMLLDEGVSPPLVSQILLRLLTIPTPIAPCRSRPWRRGADAARPAPAAASGRTPAPDREICYYSQLEFAGLFDLA